MQLRPTISFEQFKATRAAVLAAKPRHKRSGRELVVLVVFCLAFGLAVQYPPWRSSALSLLGLGVLCWILQKPLAELSQGSCLKRFYAEEQSRLNDQILTVDESGISCNRGNGETVSFHAWKAFIHSIDMPDAFVFLPSPNTFVRVPKETLTSSECDLIREWSSVVPRVAAN